MTSLIRRSPLLFEDDFFDIFFKPTRTLKHENTFANIIKGEKGYEIELIVPGFSKSDINIEASDGVLNISGEIEESNKEYSRIEYSVSSFNRQFTLSKDVNVEGIIADYDAGILKIHIPFNNERQNTKRIIEIG